MCRPRLTKVLLFAGFMVIFMSVSRKMKIKRFFIGRFCALEGAHIIFHWLKFNHMVPYMHRKKRDMNLGWTA